MSTTSIIVLVVVIVVVLVLLAALATVAARRRTGRRRERAEALRRDAAGQAPVVHQQEAVARDHEAEAQEKREIADSAEARAAESRRAATQERAELEDKVRTADRLDPEVDHRARDYEPTPAEHLDQHQDEHQDGQRDLDPRTPVAHEGAEPVRRPATGTSPERGAPGPVGAEPPVDPDYDRGVPSDPLDPDGPPPRR